MLPFFLKLHGIFIESRRASEPLLLVDQAFYQTISTLVEQQRFFSIAFCPDMT
jgi:hypothetical protein